MTSATKNKPPPPASVQNFPIVGIGASAGGLDAFKRFLKAIPEVSGMSFVLVQHLDPSHESILPEILQRVTKIPVHEITENIHLAPDHIYIIPSNKILTSTDGVLKLTGREKQKLNLSIDIFLTSLAEVHKEFAVGIVLSGTGSDGTLGLKAIKAHGGICMAQDLESAAYDGMPQSAIHAGVVDFILPPEDMPAQLLQIIGAYRANPIFTEQEQLPKDDDVIFKQILFLLRQRSGVDFTYYKQPTLQRRIARRMAIGKKKNLTDYLKFLRSEKAEQDALFMDVLIPVTSFFRDPKTFEALGSTVFPELLKNLQAGLEGRAAHESIRIWIAGCSTGEEAYSIAISLHEYLTATLQKGTSIRQVQIFASDISESAIKKARTGFYPKAALQMFTPAQLENYFTSNNGGYEVCKLIRDMCVFALHNFLKDPPFAKIDLICCRNVLIYMDTFLQNKALTTFHYALKENGFLLLGKSETIGTAPDLYLHFTKQEKIYQRKQGPGRFLHISSTHKETAMATKNLPGGQDVVGLAKTEPVHTDFRKSAEQILLSKHTPPSVIVNEQMDIVHIHGNIAPFLEAPQGKPSFNLLKMAREGLAFELRNALHKAKTSGEAVTKDNIPVHAIASQNDDAWQEKQWLVTIQVIPLTDTVDPHFLILFTKVTPHPTAVAGARAGAKPKKDAAQIRIEQLETELAQAREDMRYISQDMEAANEELQSGNEELQSGNEEMQSLNEELETSKEELQSTNEELTIINQELLDKQEQVNNLLFYSEAIVTTAREPIVVLDGALRIKTANASFYKKFKVEEQDTEGKLLYEVQNRQFNDPMLRSLLEQILPQKNRINDFEITLNFPTLGQRILLMNARQIVNARTAEPLILLAIEDATERILLSKQLTESESKFRTLILQAPVAIATFKGPTYIVETANKSILEIWGKTIKQVINKPYFETAPERGAEIKKLFHEVYATGVPFERKEFPVQINRDGKSGTGYFDSVLQPLRNSENEIAGLILISTEVTESVNARKLVEASEMRFSNILSQSLIGIAILKGREMVVFFANEPIIEIWGKGKDVIGKTLLEVLPEIKDQPFPTLLAEVYATGVAFASDEIKALIFRNGKLEECYFNLVYQAYTEVDNTITGVTILATEITEYVLSRKRVEESEAKFRTLSETIPQMIWTATQDGTKNFFNKYYLDYTGLSLDELNDGGLEEIIFPDDLQKDLALWNHSLKTGEDFQMEKRIRRHDGTYRWHLCHSNAQKDKKGSITGWIGANTDIDAQKKFTEEVIATKNSAEQALTSKQQFLSNMSHEIRTPMNAVVGFTKVLLKTDMTEKQREYLHAIKTSGDNLIVLINDILDLAKVDSGKMEFEKSPFKMDLTLSNILYLFEVKIQEKNLVLVKEYDHKIPEVLVGDPVRLHQIILNLVSNAIKFTTKGSITVGARLLEEDEAQATLEFAVADTGIGIEKDSLKHIFENFEQATSSTSRLYGGTGLGLAIAKQLVEKQGGTIGVKSKINEGATFSFVLSFQKSNAEVGPTPASVELGPVVKNIKVLVAEDVPLNQLLIRTILADFQFTCDIAGNGKTAIEKLQTNAYDIILMDLQMPEMDGFEATEYIRNTMNNKIPIIALTADVTTMDLEKCKAIGMNDYIAKPLDEDLLYRKIIDLLADK